MQKAILLAAILALASGVSAAYWRQCEPLGTKINRFEIHGCDSDRSTDDRCAIEMGGTNSLEIDYLQPKPIKKPVIRTAPTHNLNSWSQSIGCTGGLECPGEADQEQHFKEAVYFRRVSTHPDKSDFRLTIREYGSSPDDPGHLCVEYSVLLIPQQK